MKVIFVRTDDQSPAVTVYNNTSKVEQITEDDIVKIRITNTGGTAVFPTTTGEVSILWE